jgi:hypothetical protein
MANHAINIVTFYGRTEAIEAIKKDAQNCRHNQILEGLYPNPSGDNDDENWCLDNWGTKWGAYQVKEREEQVHTLFSEIDDYVFEPHGDTDEFQYDAELDVNEFVTFEYSTAWSPASDALDHISKKYNVVAIEAFCEGGENYCGYRVHALGEIESECVESFIDEYSPILYNKDTCEFEVLEEAPDEDDVDEDYIQVNNFVKEMFEATGSFCGSC